MLVKISLVGELNYALPCPNIIDLTLGLVIGVVATAVAAASL